MAGLRDDLAATSDRIGLEASCAVEAMVTSLQRSAIKVLGLSLLEG